MSDIINIPAVENSTLLAQNQLLTAQNEILQAQTEQLTTIARNLTSLVVSGITLKGTIGTGGTVTALPSSHGKGDAYIVITARTYAGASCAVGDVIVALGTSGTSANDWSRIAGFMASDGAAKYAIENYAGSRLLGTNQTIVSAFNALNSNFSGTSVIRFTTDSNGIMVNVPTNFRGILYTFDSSPNRLGMYFLYRVGSSSGLANMKTIVSASDLTFDTTNPGKLKISSPGLAICAIWNVNNKVTV